MTTKELLYVDDALSHAQLLATQFRNAADQLQDNSLRTQVKQMAQRHCQMYQQFYNQADGAAPLPDVPAVLQSCMR